MNRMIDKGARLDIDFCDDVVDDKRCNTGKACVQSVLSAFCVSKQPHGKQEKGVGVKGVFRYKYHDRVENGTMVRQTIDRFKQFVIHKYHLLSLFYMNSVMLFSMRHNWY